MDSSLRRGLFLVTLTGMITFSPVSALAADNDVQSVMPGVGIEQVLNECATSEKEIEVEEYLVPTEKGEYLDMAFADVSSFLYIRSEPTIESAWVGKLYPNYAAKIIGPVGEWTKVQSGSVTGYVYSKYITIGNQAEQKAQEIIQQSNQDDEEEAFQYAESKEEEQARLAKEAEEEAARIQSAGGSAAGQAVVDYACQFIGNPYVWGGTSLTNGADCSGYIQSVFAHFGISVPRTSSAQRSAGVGVSYSEAMPGDIICYDGHVGIYIGNGQIVNAMNPSKGIGITTATYTNILTVRRVV